MTNADVANKHEFHAEKPTTWEMSESKTVLPGVPTPEVPSGPTGPSNKKEVEEAIDKTPYLKSERASKRTLDTAVQKPTPGPTPGPKKISPGKVLKPTPGPKPSPTPPKPAKDHTKPSGQEIWGPKAPMLDPNQPSPSDSDNGNNKSGVYPDIYGPERLGAPGSKDNGGDPSMYDYVPAAEFPAGPLQPSPYLNDFSKILKT